MDGLNAGIVGRLGDKKQKGILKPLNRLLKRDWPLLKETPKRITPDSPPK
jgi:hypothetical protein